MNGMKVTQLTIDKTNLHSIARMFAENGAYVYLIEEEEETCQIRVWFKDDAVTYGDADATVDGPWVAAPAGAYSEWQFENARELFEKIAEHGKVCPYFHMSPHNVIGRSVWETFKGFRCKCEDWFYMKESDLQHNHASFQTAMGKQDILAEKMNENPTTFIYLLQVFAEWDLCDPKQQSRRENMLRLVSAGKAKLFRVGEGGEFLPLEADEIK